MDHAEYVGPLAELKGHRALVQSDETYELPLEQRTLKAQFDEFGLRHPQTKVLISHNWHTFPAKDFKLLVRVW